MSKYQGYCPECNSDDWDWAVKPREWREITKGQIDDCLKHSDNYDFAWAIEAICKQNNGY